MSNQVFVDSDGKYCLRDQLFRIIPNVGDSIALVMLEFVGGGKVLLSAPLANAPDSQTAQRWSREIVTGIMASEATVFDSPRFVHLVGQLS